ncbi:carboxymuconolactone decarboxylase family protein [Pedobacter ginsengiterrae]
MNIQEIRPEAFNAQIAFANAIKPKIITPIQTELLKIRISQINGCFYCLKMHTEKAISIGETQSRLTALPVWREAPLFTQEEKSILELAERLTLIHSHQDPYEGIVDIIGKDVATDVLMTTVAINSWNRIMKTQVINP